MIWLQDSACAALAGRSLDGHQPITNLASGRRAGRRVARPGWCADGPAGPLVCFFLCNASTPAIRCTVQVRGASLTRDATSKLHRTAMERSCTVHAAVHCYSGQQRRIATSLVRSDARAEERQCAPLHWVFATGRTGADPTGRLKLKPCRPLINCCCVEAMSAIHGGSTLVKFRPGGG